MPLGKSRNNIILNRIMARIGNIINKKIIRPEISIIASKKFDKIWKKGCVKHEEQKENSTWNIKFINLDVCCIQPFWSIRL